MFAVHVQCLLCRISFFLYMCPVFCTQGVLALQVHCLLYRCNVCSTFELFALQMHCLLYMYNVAYRVRFLLYCVLCKPLIYKAIESSLVQDGCWLLPVLINLK